MTDCPVCLEPLTGTVVHLACCRNQVHIQCYVPKCPLCRAELPSPPNLNPTHTIIPVPVPLMTQEQQRQMNRRVLVANTVFATALVAVGYILFTTTK